jgi:uncharacterized membrane protein YbhN (UPF0104 family)
MPTIPAISTIAQTIQLSLAPVFMLAGIGQLLNVLAGRLSVSSAIMTCILIALLFIAELAKLHFGTYVALCFILAMILLIAALVSFIFEVRISLRAFRIRPELLRPLP